MRWKRFLFAGNQNNQQDPWQKRPDGRSETSADTRPRGEQSKGRLVAAAAACLPRPRGVHRVFDLGCVAE